MKLHLPKMLLTAVLAVIGSSFAQATTYTVTQGNDAFVHSCTFKNESNGSTATWSTAAANGSDAILHFEKSEKEATALVVKYNDFSTGGVTVDSDSNITGIKNDGTRLFYIGKDAASSASIINRNFTFNTNNGIYLKGTQSWTVAKDVTFSFTGSNVTNTGAITMSGDGFVDFTNKTISGNGSIYVSDGTLKNATFAKDSTLYLGTDGNVEAITMNNGSVLDLSKFTFSSTTAAVDTSKITLGSGTIVNLSNLSNGSTVAIFSSTVDGVTLLIDGKKMTDRTKYTASNGVYTFTDTSTGFTDMVWAGGNGTWNKSNTNWNSATYGNGIAFVNGDTVTFDSSAAVVVGEGVSVEEMIVSGDKTTLELTRENSGYIAGKVTITDDATMIIKSKTDQTGFVRGEINVEDGILQFDAKDVTGYSGGANSTSKITIAAGSELLLNHNSNETFAGTLVLNGTLKGITTNKSQWDLFGGGKDGGSAKIIVEDNQNAIIKNTTIRLRQRDSVFELGAGSTLEIEDIIKYDLGTSDQYTAKIITKGTGQLTANGSIQADVIEITEGGTITMKDDSAVSTEVRVLRGALNVGTKDSDAVLSTARLELGDSGSSGNGSMLNIASNSLVKVTGNGNSDSYNGCSLMLGEWEAKATVNIDGALLAKDAKAVTGDAGMVINVNKGGTMAVAGIGIALRKDGKSQAITLDVKDGGKLILGSSGIEANLKSGSGITLNAGTIGMYADTTTLGAAMTLNSTTGTIFDTAKYAFATDGNSISQTATATGGDMTISGVLSGTGKLVKQGVGSLTLSANNTYSGGTSVNAGTITAAHSNALGTGKVQVSGGILQGTVGLNITELEQTAGQIKFTAGDTYITKSLSATDIDVTGSDKFALGVVGGTDKTKVFTIGTVTGSTKWELNEGQVSLTGESYTVESLDVSKANKSVADLSIGEGSTVTVKGDTWLNRSASISLDKDATINLGSTVSVKGVSSEEGAKGQIVRREDGDPNSTKGDKYLTNNVEYSIKNAHVTITSDSDVNLNNQLDNSAITNNGTGTVILGFGASDRTEVNALKGNINMMWMDGEYNRRTDSLSKLEIGDNLTVAAQVGDSAIASITKTNLSTLEVTKTAIIGSNATVKANLTLTDGATLTLSGFGDNAATINGNLTLGAELKLAGEEFLEALGNLESGEMLKILNVEGAFSGLEADLSIAADAIIEEQPLIVGYTTSNYYSSLNVGDYALIFQGTELFIKNTAPIPEPTTATLSLLALTALAARRRRK